ncbi:MAG TPA: acyl carrier protein [Acidimicrobiia bacterium]|nr:acyl carrier protein [Acidimicrobiia bacterium]
MTVKERLRHFLLTGLDSKLNESVLTDTYPLLETEAIDSLAVFAIVQFLEDEFGIEVGDDDLVVDNFASIEAMAKLVEAKQGND